MAEPRDQRILLIGMMGAGKTTIGRLLARRLGWAHLDSDEGVERRTGKTVSELFAEQGEAAFRAAETAVLEEAVTAEGPLVLSVAGGAVLSAANRATISRAGFVVWLRADVGTLVRRVGGGEGRPLLQGDARSRMERLYRERRPLYEQLADLTIDVDRVPAAQIVERAIAALPARGQPVRPTGPAGA